MHISSMSLENQMLEANINFHILVKQAAAAFRSL